MVRYVPEFSFKTRSYNNKLKVEHLLAQSTGVIANAYDNLIEANFEPERIIPHFKSWIRCVTRDNAMVIRMCCLA